MATDLLKFDVRYIDLANDHLSGMEIEDLSLKYNLPQFRIAEVLELPEIKRYTDKLVANVGYNNRLKRALLLERIIDKKVEEMEDSDIWSRKDIVEILKLAQDEDKLNQPKTPSINIDKSKTSNNYISLMEDLFKDEAVDAEVLDD